MSLSIIFDAVTAVVLIASTIIMSRKGIMKSVFHILSIVITIAVVMTFSGKVYDYFEYTPAAARVDAYVQNVLIGKNARQNNQVQEGEAMQNTENSEDSAKSLPEFIYKPAQNAVQSVTVSAVSDTVKRMICIIALYIVCKILLALIFKIIELIFHLPLLSHANRLLGGAVGLVSGILILCIVSGALSFDVANADAIRDAMDKTYVAKYFYDKNLLMSLLLQIRFLK